jgi:hypothetical protein
MYPSAQRQTPIGGISRLDQDPPRHGVNGWRPSGTILR